jgi:hypothetical protein
MNLRPAFGESVPGYEIPVLNEREIRAAAGILLVMMLFAIQRVIYTWDFVMLKYVSVIFLADILIRVLVSPRFAPTLVLGRLIVRKQTPEYVGAAQKRFAWWIGAVLGGTMFVLLVVLNTHSPITGILCLICQIFLFFESAFGICLGCKVYPLVMRKKPQLCPGEVCDIKARQPIQKTSAAQGMALLAFVAGMVVVGMTAKSSLREPPQMILGMKDPRAAK